jgi:CRISPR-associated exonuclease Cas4
MAAPPAEEERIPISAVQHAVYCLRQAALIHIERMWEDNLYTAEGNVLHEVADKGGRRTGRVARRVLSLPLGSDRLNLSGTADLVEFRPRTEGGEQAFPVEYKRGKPKRHRADEAQLCAQALCLEEMTGLPVPEGALYYAQTKRRVTVPIDASLRALTEAAIADLAHLFATRNTPPPTPHRARCRGCSLLDLCRPDTVSRPVKRWRDQTLARLLAAP